MVISAFAILCLLMPGPGRAAGTVASCTEANLHAAMAGGGTVTFACDGTILLRNNLPTNVYHHPIPITQDTVLDATGHQITISGTNTVEGMFYVSNNVTLALVNLTLANGLSTNGGSAIWIQSGTVCATNCTLIGNTARVSTNFDFYTQLPNPAQGGAILNEAGYVNLQHCQFTSNSAVPALIQGSYPFYYPVGIGAGGAIFNTGSLIMDNCGFVQNWAASGVAIEGDGGWAYGGAIYNAGSLVVSRSSFISNSAAGGPGLPGTDAQGVTPAGPGGDGGDAAGSVIYSAGSLLMLNSTVAANTSTGGDGGPGGRRWDGGPPPPAGQGGSAFGAIYGSANLVNNTVALNSGYVGGGVSGGSAYGGCGGGFNTLLFSNTPERNDTFADPKLGPLADNGGPTLTMAMLPGSPAIDAGSALGAPATDQRGVYRPQGPGVDIGAFEYQYSPVFTGAIIINATNHLVQLNGLTSNLNLTLQVSTNLLNWWDATNFMACSNGMFQCADPIPCDVQTRFYRLKSGTP